ncbi:MAG: phosphoesterase [Desulfobacteraceae bacterium]|nr:phosphoesterase [Desulfobacteraceae bacterium]
MKKYNAKNLFFTADSHFGHQNIIRFCERPFTNIETMDDALIRNWNAVVPTDGIVFHLGDFSFHKGQHSKFLLEQLNGRIILIQGNHDKQVSYFKEVHQLLEIKVVDNLYGKFGGCSKITLCHFPMAIWNNKHYGSWHLHGHSHGTYKPATNMSDHHFKGLPEDLFFKYNKLIDVGVDVWDYKPVAYETIAKILGKDA